MLVQIYWSYIKAGKWGSCTNLTELESLARILRQTGHYDEASIIYWMIARGLDSHTPSTENLEFLADVLTNLGLVYTQQRKFEAALGSFDRSSDIMSELGTLTPHASMPITYNKAVVFMMTDRLDEAEVFLRDAAAYFSQDTTAEHTPTPKRAEILIPSDTEQYRRSYATEGLRTRSITSVPTHILWSRRLQSTR